MNTRGLLKKIKMILNKKLGYKLFYSKNMSIPLIYQEKYCPDRDDFHEYMTRCYAKKSVSYQNLPAWCTISPNVMDLDAIKITDGKLPLFIMKWFLKNR